MYKLTKISYSSGRTDGSTPFIVKLLKTKNYTKAWFNCNLLQIQNLSPKNQNFKIFNSNNLRLFIDFTLKWKKLNIRYKVFIKFERRKFVLQLEFSKMNWFSFPSKFNVLLTPSVDRLLLRWLGPPVITVGLNH